jgi:V8-like Glu-specific endopeptidase
LSIITSGVADKITSVELIRKLKVFIPNLNQVEEYLRADSIAVISNFFPAKRNISSEKPESTVELKINQKKLILDRGLFAIEKIRLDKQKQLSQQERFALCCIIANIGRPALLIQNDHFPQKGLFGQTGGLPPNWWILDNYRGQIEQTCKSVGRIEPYDSGDPDKPKGTGFLVAKDIIMTNRHVTDHFCNPTKGAKWKIRKSNSPRVDYAEEYGSNEDCEFAIKKVIGVHDTLDLALLQVNRTSTKGKKLPMPLVIDSKLPQPIENRNVYVVGYPFQGSQNDDPEDVKLVFNDLDDGYKRLQPGIAKGADLQASFLYHDCSTIDGNSGSCVVDLEKNTVIGLHFSGELIRERNLAVALPLLKNDPLLVKAGVKFS